MPAHPLLRGLSWRATLPIAALAANGCAGLAYSTHAVWGGLKVLAGRQKVEAMLADPEVPRELKASLVVAEQARQFASRELHLPDNESYRRYKDLGRPYATWTVTVAPELSVEPVVWCFPVAGCVSYRGYFSLAKAEKFSARMRARGYDVDVGGVRAYSTLGWFADPLLNTFVELPETEMVGLIFHELAHQVLYVEDDTVFNESFATCVELEGMRRWLHSRGDSTMLAVYQEAKRRERDFVQLVKEYRARLAEVYDQDRPDQWKLREKTRLLERLRDDYRQLKRSWGGEGKYDPWFDQGLNNARLASVSAYFDRLPAFCALLHRCSGSLQCFYRESERIAKAEPAARAATLDRLAAELTPGDRCLHG